MTDSHDENISRIKRHMRAPIFENCLNFIKNKPTEFFCPGHRGGRSFDPTFAKVIPDIDICNLSQTDTLHCPKKSILKAEILLADAYGVDKSFILVGGSTSGNIASIMTIGKPDQKILVQRNSHKSIVAGIILSGALPVWLNPVWNEDFCICLNLETSTIEESLLEHPDSKGVFVLNPTYYGSVPDIRSIVETCHRSGQMIAVDQAHGPHFHFYDELPTAAEDVGADLIVQSTHKILSALSQGSVLHLNKRKIGETSVRKVLQLIQTTSPSFPIMASIDLSRRQMVLEGYDRLKQLYRLAKDTRERLRQIPGITLLEKPATPFAGSGFYSLDETKILINTKALGISGYEFLKRLNVEFNIQPEISGPFYVLFLFTIGTNEEDANHLVNACTTLVNTLKQKNDPRFQRSQEIAEQGRILSASPQVEMSPRKAFFSSSIDMPIKKCVGHVCAEVVTPYPPGIPLLMPGELITRDIIDFLIETKRSGNPISSTDPTLTTLQVVGKL